MKRLIFNILTLIVVGLAVLNVSEAFFSDTESSVGNVLAAGILDLKIDNTSYYNGASSSATTWALADLDDGQGPGPDGQYLFFNFNDLKPGDDGEDTISIHVDDNPAWACMRLDLTKNDDNGSTEPELGDGDDPDDTEDDFDGELAQNLNFVFWTDDGDNVLETEEALLASGSASTVLDGTSIPLADSQVNNVGGEDGDPLDPENTYYIGKAWCFGELTTSPIPQDGVGDARTPIGPEGPGVACDGTFLDNTTQTDLVMGDVHFEAVQARSLPEFVCGEPIPTVSPTITPTPTPLACLPAWADTVESSAQGLRKNGSSVPVIRSDPDTGLVAQTTGAVYDNPVVEGTFFSMGFGGTIVVSFSAPITNGPGDDLKVFEVTGGSDYPDEKLMIEASSDGVTYTELASSVDRDESVDLGPLASAQYIRLTDVSNPLEFEETADAYDLDGVQGLCVEAE